jgi:hypothetical protein
MGHAHFIVRLNQIKSNCLFLRVFDAVLEECKVYGRIQFFSFIFIYNLSR